MTTKAQREEAVRQGAERRLAKKPKCDSCGGTYRHLPGCQPKWPKPQCARCHITKGAHDNGTAFIVGKAGDRTTMTACTDYKEAS